MASSSHSHCDLSKKVTKAAIISRIVAILLQIVFNAIIPDHDAGVFNPPMPDDVTLNFSDRIVHMLLGGLNRWDAVYFTHIAEYGYTYENCLAFFPLFPALVRVLANSILFPLQYILSYHSVILISGVLLNVYLFMKTAENLYILGQKVTSNEKVAYIGALLFCINPASIFMAAPYSEVLYLYLSVLGMLKLEMNRKFSASVLFGFACVTRSNGLLNIGYLLYKMGQVILLQIKILKQYLFMGFSTSCTTVWIFVSLYIVPYTFLLVVSILPFSLYQYYSYALFCEKSYTLIIPKHLIDYSEREDLKIVGHEPSPWCNDTVPLAYSYIQKHYWNQGFLNYWEFKQIPNFLLAVPVTVLSLKLALSFYRNNRYICLTLGMDEVGASKKQSHDQSHDQSYYHLEGVSLLPYVLHTLVLTIFGWFFIHIQVLTRLLFAATPVLYWYTAVLLFPDTQRQVEKTNKWDVRASSMMPVETEKNVHGLSNLLTDKILTFRTLSFSQKLVICYYLGYFVIGTALFSNFLPWT